MDINMKHPNLITDYNYMDDLSLAGWMWEFIRRSKRYSKAFEALAEFHYSPNDAIIKANNKAQARKKYIDCIANFHRTGVMSEEDIKDANTYLTIAVESYSEEGLCVHAMAFPKPGIRWCDFPDNSKPRIKGICPVNIVSYEELLESYGYATLQIFLTDVSPLGTQPWNTIYIGISANADFSEVEHYLLPAIARRLKPTKNEEEFGNWKYCLIVYDLKLQTPGISYTDITSEMQEAFPENKDSFSIETCKRSFRSGLELIGGDYMKYLTLPSDSYLPSYT
jgi:hypothetical protein